MSEINDTSVPMKGREIKGTSKILNLLKKAYGITRTIESGNTNIDRRVHGLDDVKLISVPSTRFMTEYDFT